MRRKPVKVLGTRERSEIWSYSRALPDMEAPASGQWFALIANPNCEHKLVRNLDKALFRSYLPCWSVVQMVGGVRKTKAVVERPIFPRYVFAASLDPDFPFFLLTGTNGLESIVKVEGRPLPIPHSVIAEIMRRDINGDFDRRPKKLRTLKDAGFEAGDSVRIGTGPLQGFEAKVEALVGRSKARVLLGVFGRPTSIDLPLDELEKVA